MKYPVTNNASDLKAHKRISFKKVLVMAFVFIVMIGIAVALIIKGNYDHALIQQNSESPTIVVLNIEKGESLQSITQKLINKGLLRSDYQTYFDFYVRTNGLYPKMQAGTFKIPQNLTIPEITQALQKAGIPDIWITIPEGLRKDEIADILAKGFGDAGNTTFTKKAFLALTTDKAIIGRLTLNIPNLTDLEGFLFPDRYLFPLDSKAEDVIALMVDNFKTRTAGNYTYKIVIIASLLEREGKNDTDRKMIADIINRRLKEGWLLGLCATLLYAQKDWKAEPNTEINSPYNTYKHLGLTPTPISNPGMSSINAALNPTPNKYYYWIHDDSNTPHYGVTLADHERNIQLYLNK